MRAYCNQTNAYIFIMYRLVRPDLYVNNRKAYYQQMKKHSRYLHWTFKFWETLPWAVGGVYLTHMLCRTGFETCLECLDLPCGGFLLTFEEVVSEFSQTRIMPESTGHAECLRALFWDPYCCMSSP